PSVADRDLYVETVKFLFAEYEAISDEMARYLATQVAKPDDMTPEAYQRTLRARAFDISRYLLPLATNTSLGQIVNARTLESQVSRLLSSPYAAGRRLGEKLKQAAPAPEARAWEKKLKQPSAPPAYNVNRERWRQFIEVEIAGRDEGTGREAY